MRCPRCENELADSATFCPRCGATTRQDALPTTFSYLPAGAPPWPTAVPLRPSNTHTISGQLESKNVSQAIAKPRRSMRSLLLAVPLALLALGLGAGVMLFSLYTQGQFSNAHPTQSLAVSAPTTPGTQATPNTQTNQGNQLPTPTSFKPLSNADLNAAFQYPSDWQAEALQKSTDSNSLSVHPTQQLGIAFNISRLSTSASSQVPSADALNQNNFNNLVGDTQNVQNVQPTPSANKQPTIGGTKWTQADVTFQNSNGTKFHLTSISVQHNKIYYTIVIFAPDVYYAEAMSKYLQPMLDSFQFIS